MSNKSAIVFLAWGEKNIKQIEYCINNSKNIKQYDHLLITDNITDLKVVKTKFNQVIRTNFHTNGLIRKTEIFNLIPNSYDSFVFLDTDTIVLDDISLGFEKAKKFGICVSPAPHYSLDQFFGFDKIMQAENIQISGQLQYNTGVIFFNKHDDNVKKVFDLWMTLGLKYYKILDNDQPFFSLAMELLCFNPYTLSISYNYRGFGDTISGIIRIWHSHGKIPKDINSIHKIWPGRKAFPGKVIHQ